MRDYQTKTWEIKKRKITAITCDICKKTMDNPDGDAPLNRRQPIHDTTIRHRSEVGGIWGGQYTHVTLDICHECFDNRLLPLIEREFGVKAQTEVIPYELS